jgi:hypothetical protein
VNKCDFLEKKVLFILIFYLLKITIKKKEEKNPNDEILIQSPIHFLLKKPINYSLKKKKHSNN